MKAVRALGIVLAMILVSGLMAFPVLAATSITSVSIGCDQIEITYTSDSSGGRDEAEITIVNLDTKDVLYDSTGTFEHDAFGGSYTITFAPQPADSLLRITVMTGQSDFAEGPCNGAEGPAEDAPAEDSRFCFRAGEVDVALYAIRGGIDFYSIVGEGNAALGDKILEVTQDELEAVSADPAGPVLIAQDASAFVSLYRLPSNEYQVNAGPDDEGKMHVCIFTSAPEGPYRTFSYFVR